MRENLTEYLGRTPEEQAKFNEYQEKEKQKEKEIKAQNDAKIALSDAKNNSVKMAQFVKAHPQEVQEAYNRASSYIPTLFGGTGSGGITPTAGSSSGTNSFAFLGYTGGKFSR